ncbi:MAG TPA: DNA-processing protein DprA [Ignavibacteria bacterium]|nr:DNA-processing protein DprA [Ignavibacteria bacterium]
MNLENLKYLYFLNAVKLLGNVRICNIINRIDSIDKLFSLSIKELINIDGISEKIANEILKAQKNLNEINDSLSRLLEICEKGEIKIVTILDDNFPKNLKNIYDTPVYLFYKGSLSQEDEKSIGIVGTRNPSEYGNFICSKITSDLVKYNLMIISGMALGIDSVAHKKCIQNGNKTYAVLGCGVDFVYPRGSKKLYDAIIENGAVISEYLPGTEPDKINFPKRNRIISGISLGTVIVESGLKGGSLITAEYALDQNRELFAIPGNITSKESFGTNELIKKGFAKLVTNVDDILIELDSKLNIEINKKTNVTDKVDFDLNNLTSYELTIYKLLSNEPVHIDKINENSGLSISDCLVNLLTLEFKGIVKQLPGKYFLKC